MILIVCVEILEKKNYQIELLLITEENKKKNERQKQNDSHKIRF